MSLTFWLNCIEAYLTGYLLTLIGITVYIL